MQKTEFLAIIGMGYVGLPLAIEFGKKRPTIGFDISKSRIDQLNDQIDITNEVDLEAFNASTFLEFSYNENILNKASHFIITVPTPVDKQNNPDTSFLISASKMVAKYISENSHIIYESTVYPGATEEICIPILEEVSGLKLNKDFFVGYSPERINPGDRHHTVSNITKITSGSSPEAADFIDELYQEILEVDTHKAPSIKVAEAAKVIENTQRDVNIALINELSIIFNKLGIDTKEVLDAASTKWNFMKFQPGLVGGHCIGVDPYYLTFKAKSIGYNPQIILSGRELNNSMPEYVSYRLLDLLSNKEIDIKNSSILILGATFKENCPDMRNSKVIDLVASIKKEIPNVDIYDPWIKNTDNLEIKMLKNFPAAKKYDGIILAVPHANFIDLGIDFIRKLLKPQSVFFDMKGAFPKEYSDARL